MDDTMMVPCEAATQTFQLYQGNFLRRCPSPSYLSTASIWREQSHTHSYSHYFLSPCVSAQASWSLPFCSWPMLHQRLYPHVPAPSAVSIPPVMGKHTMDSSFNAVSITSGMIWVWPGHRHSRVVSTPVLPLAVVSMFPTSGALAT